jgi:hypothetical protein
MATPEELRALADRCEDPDNDDGCAMAMDALCIPAGPFADRVRSLRTYADGLERREKLENEQRDRVQEIFKDRPKTAPTADFNLPAPNDPIDVLGRRKKALAEMAETDAALLDLPPEVHG